MNISALRALGKKCSLCGIVGRGQKKSSSIGPVHVACADAIAAGKPLPRGEPEDAASLAASRAVTRHEERRKQCAEEEAELSAWFAEPEEPCIPGPYTQPEPPPTPEGVERPARRRKAARTRHSAVGREVVIRGDG